MTIDGVVVFDTMHEGSSSMRERTRTLSVVVSGYRRLVVEYCSNNPLYRSVFVEWLRPSSSVFERIEEDRFVISLSFVEYMQSKAMIEADEETRMEPFVNRALLESVLDGGETPAISFSVKHDDAVKAIIDAATGLLTILPIQVVDISEVTVTVSVQRGDSTAEFRIPLQFMVLDGEEYALAAT